MQRLYHKMRPNRYGDCYIYRLTLWGTGIWMMKKRLLSLKDEINMNEK